MALFNCNFGWFTNFPIPVDKTQEKGRFNVPLPPFIAFPCHRSKITTAPNLVSVASYSPQHHHYQSIPTFEVTTPHHEKTTMEISAKLRNYAEKPVDRMILIDALQRLAIDYHFQEEIEETLSILYTNIMANRGGTDAFAENDLHEVSLCFRLLRQEGYPVPSDVFKSFMDNDGKFKASLAQDVRGMTSLYEAAQFAVEGEAILDEANHFTTTNLRASAMMTNSTKTPLLRMAMDAMERPCHKSLPRFVARSYMEDFGTKFKFGRDGVLLQELAKSDFEIVRSLYQTELSHVSKWWRELGLSRELKFARDQPLKWYIWSVASLPDPKFSSHRIELTKPISLIYLMDDIFDVYGTLDELILFTDAINKWDLKAMEKLPDQMKLFGKALYDMTAYISLKVLKQYGWDPSDSLQKAWISLCNAFLVEAKWFASGHIPKADEYLKNGIISSGVHIVFVHIFFLLGQGITKESVDLLDKVPTQVATIAAILRLWDDLGSAKDENQEGHDGSYIECYMKENESSSLEDAKRHVLTMISTAWKRLNEECLLPNPFPPSFIKASINFAKTISLMYSYNDKQQLPILDDLIKSMLFH